MGSKGHSESVNGFQIIYNFRAILDVRIIRQDHNFAWKREIT